MDPDGPNDTENNRGVRTCVLTPRGDESLPPLEQVSLLTATILLRVRLRSDPSPRSWAPDLHWGFCSSLP